jgi:ribosome-associated heat shock protein Hsp15
VSEAGESCRVDVWLWRARFFKTRSLAARMVEEGCIRLSRGGPEFDLDKPSRLVRPGDNLVLIRDETRLAVRIEALGERRGPAPEARALYSVVQPLARLIR